MAGDRELFAADGDLFGLAQTVAQNAGGMVSIEDPQSHVLAYSASDEAADPLRVQSILGREGPRDYLQVLRKWGVFDRLRQSDEVIDVPAHAELSIKRRLVISIRQPAPSGPPRVLGSIWLQQGDQPLQPDAPEVLRGASAIAARIISRSLETPDTEARLLHGLFSGEGDIPFIANALHLPMTGPAAVVGFAAAGPAPIDPATLGTVLRLHASSFRYDAVATVLDGRVYVLIPGYRSDRAVTAWTRQLVEQLEAQRALVVRAALALPVADLTGVADGRAEVDRVLDSLANKHRVAAEARVTTLAESRTAVLLGEILDLVGARSELADPRLSALFAYDRKHSANLCESVETYLHEHGDVRNAAAALNVHPNTLRYRIRRVEQIVGINLTDPADRLLLEVQLAVHDRELSRPADTPPPASPRPSSPRRSSSSSTRRSSSVPRPSSSSRRKPGSTPK